MYLMQALKRSEFANKALKSEINATTIAKTATPATTAQPAKIIAAATTTSHDDVLIVTLKEQGVA